MHTFQRLEEAEAIFEGEDLDALPAPLDPTERPLPTSVLMQLSSRIDNRPSAPSQTAMVAPCLEVFPEHAGFATGRCGHMRAQAEIDMRALRQWHAVSILFGLVLLFLLAVVIVELVWKIWRRKPYILLSHPGRIMLDRKEQVLLRQQTGIAESSDAKTRT
ncbi:MAG: hypothetical protein M1830_002678 [Pleopsidium flavum]|nr:MAG: hypothetical protein M1830_002678 [Pleopsidium flavum]